MRGFSRVTLYLSAAALVAVAAALVFSCNVYNSSLLTSKGGSGGGGTGGGTGGTAGASGDGGLTCHWGDCWWSKTDPTTGCHTVGLPTVADRPAPTGGKDIPPIYLGVKQIWTGESSPDGATKDPYQHFGLDLDGTCTNPTGCSSPKQKDLVSCAAPSGVPADGLGCRDNMFAKLEPEAAKIPLTKPFGVGEAAYNCSFYRGSFNIIVKISNYNGTPNDDTVRIDAYMSPGLEDNLPSWNCVSDPTPQKDQPTWIPTQRWYVDQDDLSGPITTKGQLPPAKYIFDAQAYVRQGYLVGRIPDGRKIRFIGDNSKYPGFSLILYGAEVVGHLHKNQDSLWVLDDALVVGKVKTADLLNSFRLIGVCPNTVGCAYYNILQSYLSTFTDISSSARSSPSTPCDAISVGFAALASTITPGDAKAVSPQVPCVPPAGVATDAGPADGGCE